MKNQNPEKNETIIDENKQKKSSGKLIQLIKKYATFLKFSCSSISSSLLDLIVFQIIISTCYGLFGDFTITVGTVIARIFSTLCAYLINRNIVFKDNKNMAKTGSEFIILTVVKTLMSAVFVTKLFEIFGGIQLIWKVIVDVTLFWMNYFMQKLFIFKKDKQI